MRKWIFIATILISGIAEAQTYVLNTEINPPFSMRKNQKAQGKPDDPLMGIAVEAVKVLFQRVKIPHKIRVYDWKVAYERSLKNPNEGCFPTTRTPAREKRFKWVGPLVASDWYFFGPKDSNFKYIDLKDPKLKNLKIGTLKDGAIENYLQEFKIPLVSKNNSFISINQLKKGEIDLLAIEGQQGHYWAKRVGLKVKRIGVIKRHRFLYLAFNKKVSQNLVKILNKELGKMRRDGTVRGIFRKYHNL
jgi:polar amino acid transport system substrate-binding protein